MFVKLLQLVRIGQWPILLRKPLCLWFIRRKSLKTMAFRTKLNGYIFRGDAANLIDYHVLSRGSFEPGITELLCIWSQHQQREGLLLDVGANVGVHSLSLSPAYRQILAVEPFPPLIDRLSRHLKENNIQNIELIKGGLGSDNGKATFQAPDAGNLGTGHVTSACTDDRMDNQIEIFKGDSLLESSKYPLHAVKIDVEGFEIDVLKGLRKSLQQWRPLIVSEVLTNAPSHLNAFIEAIPKNYRFLRLNRVKRKAFYLTQWCHEEGDIVACPLEKVSSLEAYIREQ
ncbi:MAG: FkbM family methyltransferase [Opitutales bacterium]